MGKNLGSKIHEFIRRESLKQQILISKRLQFEQSTLLLARCLSVAMGAFGSKNTVAPMLPASAVSASQVSEAVKALGTPYIPYAKKLEENGMDGAFLDAITADDLPALLVDIGVTSSFHQKKLEIVFNSFKTGSTGDAKAPGDEIQTPSASPSEIVKAFAAFLSHYKLECGTEARLVQLQLRPIIGKNPFEASSHEVFLDSDDLSDLRNLLQHVM